GGAAVVQDPRAGGSGLHPVRPRRAVPLDLDLRRRVMAGDTMHVVLEKVGPCAFEGADGRGHSVRIDGPASLGGTDSGMRPMELFLQALASCSAVDVVLILQQGRQQIDSMRVEVEGQRADATPAVFTHIKLHFSVSGQVAQNKLDRAIALSVEKYCSVAKMLGEGVAVEAFGTVVAVDP